MKQKLAFIFIMSLLIFLNSELFSKQEEAGLISGKVIDGRNKKPLVGANVFIVGTTWGAATSSSGKFVIHNIPLGVYKIKVTMMGYQPGVKKIIISSEKSKITLNFELKQTVIKLEPIVVTPGYFSLMKNNPVQRLSISKKEIDNLPNPMEDIFRDVHLLPGVVSSNFAAKFRVRGGEDDEVLMMVDDMELYEPFHLKDITFRGEYAGGAISIINSNIVRNINIMLGGFPAVYGDKMSGVLDIKTDEEKERPFSGSIGLNVLNSHISFKGALPKGSWLVSGRRGYIDIVEKMLNADFGFTTNYSDLLAKISYWIRDNHNISLETLIAQDKLKVLNDDGSLQLSSNYQSKYYWLKWKWLITKNAFSKVIIFAGNSPLQRKYPFKEDEPTLNFIKKSADFDGIKMDLSWKVTPNHLLQTGLNYQNFSSNFYRFQQVENQISADSVMIDTTIFQAAPKQYKLKYFIQDKWRLSKYLIFNLGLRYDYQEYFKDSQFSPRLGFALNLPWNTVLRGAWGNYYQSADLTDVLPFAEKEETAFKFQDYKRTEEATHYMLGIEHIFNEKTIGRLEIYYKDLKYLACEKLTHGISHRSLFLYPDKGYAQGLEVFTKRTSNNFSWWLSYAYAVTKYIENSEEYYREFDQRHTLSLETDFRISKNWGCNIVWAYHSGLPYTERHLEKRYDDEGKERTYVIYHKINGARYPAFNQLDLKIRKYFPRIKMSFYFGALNILNTNNVSYYTWKYYKVNNEWEIRRIPQYDFPLIPYLGMNLKF